VAVAVAVRGAGGGWRSSSLEGSFKEAFFFEDLFLSMSISPDQINQGKTGRRPPVGARCVPHCSQCVCALRIALAECGQGVPHWVLGISFFEREKGLRTPAFFRRGGWTAASSGQQFPQRLHSSLALLRTPRPRRCGRRKLADYVLKRNHRGRIAPLHVS